MHVFSSIINSVPVNVLSPSCKIMMIMTIKIVIIFNYDN